MTTQNGRVKLTREEARNIKKLDHKQMQNLMQEVYNTGKEDGSEQNDCRKLVEQALKNVKGIGEKRKEIILDYVEILSIKRQQNSDKA
nr:MAG TPA: hypothetical protein [Caudoviricetes sp.]